MKGMINSKKDLGEIEVLEKVGNNDYLVLADGVKCHAIYNGFVGMFYADDVYRKSTNKKSRRNLTNFKRKNEASQNGRLTKPAEERI